MERGPPWKPGPMDWQHLALHGDKFARNALISAKIKIQVVERPMSELCPSAVVIHSDIPYSLE